MIDEMDHFSTNLWHLSALATSEVETRDMLIIEDQLGITEVDGS